MEKHRVLMIVCDGMGDRADRAREFQTPLSVAKKPNIDALAREGSVGLIDPVAPGVRPGSDVAHLAILGYNPYEFYTGRGGLEAAGAGLRLGQGDVAFRSNFATVDAKMVVKDRRAGRRIEGRDELAKAVNEIRLSDPSVTFEFVPTVEHRAVMIMKGKGLSRKVSDTDPHIEGMPILRSMPEDEDQASKRTADILNEFTEKSYEALNEHAANIERARQRLLPANIILSRGPGTLPPLEPLAQKYSIDAACIAVAPIVRGICRVAGMELVEVQGATGGLDTDFKAKVSAAVQAMKRHDLVFLHIKAADVASHDGNFEKKTWVIERIDEAMAQVIESVDLANDYVLMTSDHATPVTFRDHSADPVPVLVAGPDFDVSQTVKFSERTAATGNLGRLLALHLMPIMMNRLGKVGKFGF